MTRWVIPLLWAATSALAQREVASVRLNRVASAAARPRVLFPQARFSLTTRPPPGLPAGLELSALARYARVLLGGRAHRLVFDAPEGAHALGILYGGGEHPSHGRARAMGKEAFGVDFEAADCGGQACNVRLLYRGTGVTGGVIELAHHMRGTAVLSGVVREVILVDADADGRFNGAPDRWVALRARKATRIKTLPRAAALMLGEPQIPFEADGRAITVEGVAQDGSGLTLVLDTPKMTMRAVLKRRYADVRRAHFEEFERELVSFVESHDLDPKRPRVRARAAWNAIPLTKAKRVAREQGRPLLVNLFAENNAWCYRYDFYTFGDEEVDRLLRRFVLVRIDAEKDPEKSYQQSNARGLPTLWPLTREGKPVRFRVRTRGEDRKVRDFAGQETMITGWQRPQELAVNLRRILKACSER